jgi:thiamine biosynthesis lipoprotein
MVKINSRTSLLIPILIAIFTAKLVPQERLGRTFYLMGTYAFLEIPGKDNELKAYRYMRKLEYKLSDYIDTSEISMINNNAGIRSVKVSKETIEIIKLSIEISKKTWGYFDITVGAVTINSKRYGRISLEEAKNLINYKDIQIDGDKVFLKKKGMAIDLGGIGKGFAVEKAYQYIGTASGFISIAGDMKVWGHKRILAIKDPINGGSLLQMINGKDVSISTSGNYIKKHIETEDESAIQVTVVCENSAYADALATAVLAMPDEKRRKFIELNPDIGVLILYKDGSIFMNDSFKEFFDLIILKTKTGEKK